MATTSTHAAAAKAIRAELKAAFPTVKFSVTSESYTGGNSVRVEYTDGPAFATVQAIVDRYVYGSFDGMTDSYNMKAERSELPQVKFGFTKRNMSEEIKAVIAARFGGLEVQYVDRLTREAFSSMDLTTGTAAELLKAKAEKEEADFKAWQAVREVEEIAAAFAPVVTPAQTHERYLEAAAREAMGEFNAPNKLVVAINCVHIGDDNDYSCFLSECVYKLFKAGEFETALKLANTDPMLAKKYSAQEFSEAMQRTAAFHAGEIERAAQANLNYRD